MALPVSLNSRIWSAKGIKPAAGDEVYSAGDQPIAPYDNWAMWSVTRDLHNITAELGDHGDHHEVGGTDELDLQNLKVNGMVALNADEAADEFRLVDASTSTSIARFDLDGNVIRQFPNFMVSPRFLNGLQLEADVTNANATALYDRSAGSDGKFHHAKYADEAQHADNADNAENIIGHDPADFLTASEDATITGQWEFTNTLTADISGNAATAGHADTADSATNADYATNAGDANTVDGYDAADLISQASSSGEWSHITTHEHSTVGEPFVLDHQSETTYDQYKLTVYHECHRSAWPKGYFWLQLGSGGSVDERWRYFWRETHPDEERWTEHENDEGFTLAGAEPGATSTSEFIINCPQAVNDPGNHWPTVAATMSGDTRDIPKQFWYGHLGTDYPSIDTVRLESHFDTSTGKAVLKGTNL